MTVGLVVGKFAPLHRGHQLLIERARRSVDALIVAVYETPGYNPSAAVRAEWIQELYPQVEVAVLGDPRPTGSADEISRAYAEHFARSVPRRVTHVFSSEEYGPRFAHHLCAAHVAVDPERRRVPISATTVRADPYRYRRFLDPVVYRDLVRKVCFVGAESTGKTTLAEACAERFGTVWMPEYGRELFELKAGRLVFDDLLAIAEEHLRREEALIRDANRYLFCDTNAVTTEFWSTFYFGKVDPRLAQLTRRVEQDYVYVLCGTDIPWVQDGWRETDGGSVWRDHQRAVREDLARRGLRFLEVEGSLEARVDAVATLLETSAPAVAGAWHLRSG